MIERIATIQGLICAMISPIDHEGRIDPVGTRELVDFLILHGVSAVMVGGTTGEGMILDLQERRRLAEITVRQAAGRIGVIVHTGCIGTADTIALTLHAREIGATTAAIIVPYFFPLDELSLFQHFTAIAGAVPDFPLFIYSFPGNAKNDVSPALLRRLRAAAPNIAGMKSSNPDLLRFQEQMEAGGPDFCMVNGVDGLMLPALALGARGQISGNANALPELFWGLYNAFAAGDMPLARAQQQRVNRAREVLRDGLHPAYYKAALSLRGVSAGVVRAPMRNLSPEEHATLARGLAELLT